MNIKKLWPACHRLNNKLEKLIVAALVALTVFMLESASSAAEEVQRYQIVAVNEKAYLLDTKTGFTWILTHRTVAVGREPIAIPYKFIKISPVNQKDFLVETDQGTTMLSNGGQ